MKKIFSLMTLAAVTMTMVSSCSDDEGGDGSSDLSEKEQALSVIATPYVNHTVLPTYKGMADAAIELHDLCLTIQTKHANNTLTENDVKVAGDAWKTSRKYWEQSEAFLYGPAADYNIDPHIDSWPLDKAAMDELLSDIRNGKEYSTETNLTYGLLGFHAVEYMLFELSEDGNTPLTHNTNYTTEELKYLTIVTEDLRNQCVLLESCWAGIDNVSSEKQAILEEADLDKGQNYGEMMINARQAGSIYKTHQSVVEDILQGCIDIADEVGNTKIGRPNNTSGSTEDRNYIESPYALNSIVDFQDNIISIRNAYCGSQTGDASISDYVKARNPQLDTRLREAIQNAINAIADIPEPFRTHATDPVASNAKTVVGTNLVNVLNEVYQEILK